MMYRILDADTNHPVRKSRYSPETVRYCLYQLVERYPKKDFYIVDEGYNAVPVSRLKL